MLAENTLPKIAYHFLLLHLSTFMMKTIELKWDLLERIKCNSEDWELDKGNEAGITVKFNCDKSFMDTDAFHKFST